jgi:hypothetical protein
MRDIDRQTLLCLQYYLENPNVDYNDMASMFVVSRYPRKVFQNLRKDWVVEKIESGIYTIRNSDIATSIVVIPELDEELYEWLTSLKLNLPKHRLKKLINESKKYINDSQLSVLINLIIKINIKQFEEGDPNMTNELFTIIKKIPAGAKMVDECIAKGKVEGIAEGIAKGIAKGEAKGIATGIAKGKAEDIIHILTRRIDKPSARLQKKIREVCDLNQLDELIDFSLTCVSLDEFATAFN